MSDSCAISVLIPIYNAEKHLAECIESVRNQTLSDIEIILIDDGSVDKSRKIAEKYVATDSRIKLYYKKNEGVSTARNLGIERARGRYIQFVDSDDRIRPNMCEILLSSMMKQRNDLVICGYQYNMPNDRILTKLIAGTPGLYTKREFNAAFNTFFESMALQSPANKLYKRAKIIENNLRFNLNFTLGEDLLFNLEYLSTCDTIQVISDCLYIYQHFEAESLSNRYRGDYFEIQQKLFYYIRKYLKENDAYDINKIKFEAYCLKIIGSCYEMLWNGSHSLKKEEKYKSISAIIHSPGVKENYARYSKYCDLQVKIVNRSVQSDDIYRIWIYYELKFFIKKFAIIFRILKHLNR